MPVAESAPPKSPAPQPSQPIDDDVPLGVELGPYERCLYGAIWPPVEDSQGKPVAIKRPNWMIERDCLTLDRKPRGYRGRAHHLRQFISEIWGRQNDLFWIQWNPNAYEIIERYCQHSITAIAGCASSGKSVCMAVIACAEFLLRPTDTKVLVTSQTKQQSVDRIWGDINNCWTVASAFFAPWGGVPGRMLIGKYCIRYERGKIISTKSGIQLLAGDAGEEKDSSAMIQGIKSGNLILLGDEWSEMPFSIHNTALSNLQANPNARMLTALNPNNHMDPGGAICEPVGGWHKVTVDMTGWPTAVGGWCIHFNGEKSPNILDPRRPWHRILDADGLEAIAKRNPRGTKEYDRFVRGWWSATGAKQCIYDVADIQNFKADHRERRWIGPYILVAGLDIANARGGDKTVLVFGRVGPAKNDADQTQVVCERLETLVLNEDTALNDSLSEQIVSRVKKEMQDGVWGEDTPLAGQKRVVPTANLAVDCTGGGTHFAALLARDIGLGFLTIGFGEKASDLRVSKNDKRLGHEAFYNKVSELWGVGVQLIRTGQLKNLDADLVKELSIRTYESDSLKRMKIESKEDMKKRTNGRSPDISDAFALMCEAARVRGGLSSSEKAAVLPQTPVNRERLRRQQEEFFGAAEATDYRMGGWGE